MAEPKGESKEKSKGEILLAVTGGIAAYKAAALTSLLVKAEYGVSVIMTESAEKMAAKKTFHALTGRAVGTSLWSDDAAIPHIEGAKKHQLLIVAPATANIMAKAAAGIADDLVSASILAFAGPILMVPAMNSVMWQKPAVQRNFRQLAEDGIRFIGPAAGRLGCGDTGIGRMAEPEEIFAAAEAVLADRR